MTAEESWTEASANQLLIEETENLFSRNTQVLKNVLKANRELFLQDNLDKSLLSCCRNGLLHLMPTILSAGANLEVTDENGNTPLLVCVLNRHERCATCLIGAGAKVNAVNFDGNTPLIASILHCGSIEMIRLLVSSKNIKFDLANNNGCSALLYAIETANLNAMRLLIDAGGSSETNKVSDDSFLQEVTSRKGLLRLFNLFKLQKVTGKSPLLHAAIERDLESARILTSMDASIMNTSILLEFLISIQEKNNGITQSDLEMLEFLLIHNTANYEISNEKEKLLDIAISIGNGEIVDRLSQFDFVYSCQHLISSISKPDFLRLLLTKRHVINKLDPNNQPIYLGSPLHEAMVGVEIESAKALIQHGAFMDIDLALEDVVNKNLEQSLLFLLSEFPVEVGQKLQSLKKLLHSAVINSALNVIPILLDHGADINAKYNKKYCLTEALNVDVLELLLSRGADPNVKIGSRYDDYILHFFLTYNFKIYLKDKWKSLQASGVTNYFLKKEIKSFVQCLLKHGANVDLRGINGQTALHIASGKSHTIGLFKILVDSGADVNIVDIYGHTPLHICVDNKNVEKLNYLLRNNARIDIKDVRGRTALHVAVSKSKSANIIKILSDSGIDVNVTDNAGESPLWDAVYFQKAENVQCLIDAGADVNLVCTPTGKTVLFYATNEAILKILLDNGADVRARNGDCPLNSLLAKWHVGMESVKRFIDAGCNVNHKNNNGYTTLIHSAKYVDIQLIKLLVEEGADVNASGSNFPHLTAVTGMLSELWNNVEGVTSCVKYLIDLNANIDNVHFGIIHAFITFGCFSTIPSFISRGSALTFLPLEKPSNYFFTGETKLSPLMMALFLDQAELAQYFIDINYLMTSDIPVLYGHKDTQRQLEVRSRRKSSDLLKRITKQPFSLETLCLVVLSETLGPNQDRRLKVQNLELPQQLKDLLSFKNVPKKDIKNVGIKDTLLLEMSVRHINSFYRNINAE